MTNAERIDLALAHKETPQLPIDLGATRSTGINVAAYRRLRRFLGLSERLPRVFDVKQALALPDEDVLERFHVDARCVSPLWVAGGLRIDSWKEIRWDDGEGALVPANYDPRVTPGGALELCDARGKAMLRKPNGGLYFDDVSCPLGEAEIEDIEKLQVAQPDQEELEFISRQIDRVHALGCAPVYSTGFSLFERGIKDFGYEEYLVRVMTEPEQMHAYRGRLVEGYMRATDALAPLMRDRVKIFYFNDDLGMQSAPLIRPEVFREQVKPYMAQLYTYIKKRIPGAKILLHCCGSIYALIPDLIEAGVDALNPVQYDAADMDPVRLKRMFGRDITFWGGGCSTQKVLSQKDPAAVRDETRRMIDILAPGGGFVFNQVHNIQSDVPAASIAAMLEVPLEYGGGAR